MAEAKKVEGRDLNLYQKLAAITGDVGAIAKDGNNSQQNFKFIEYAAVAGRLRELFAKYGVVIVPRMVQQSKQLRSVNGKAVSVLIDFTYTVVNADSPDDKFTVTWTGEAIDYGDKATNKAATSALKYYLMRQLNISEKGDDPDAESPQVVAPAAPRRQPAPKKSSTPDDAAAAKVVFPQGEVAYAKKTEKPTRLPASDDQLSAIAAQFAKMGIDDAETRHGFVVEKIGRDIASAKDLTRAEAKDLLEELQFSVNGEG